MTVAVRLATLIGLVSLLAILLPLSVEGDEGVYVPGYTCDPRIGSRESEFVRYATGIWNTSALPEDVSCPVLVDRDTFRDPRILSLSFYVPSGAATCTLYATTEAGLAWSTTVRTPFAGHVSIDIDVRGLRELVPLGPQRRSLSHSLRCTLPPDSGLRRYELVDFSR